MLKYRLDIEEQKVQGCSNVQKMLPTCFRARISVHMSDSPNVIGRHVREVCLYEVAEVRDGVLEAVLDEARAVELAVLGDARPQPAEGSLVKFDDFGMIGFETHFDI